MLCTIKKTHLKEACSSIKRLLGNITYICLKADKKNGTLSFTLNADRYFSYSVPAKDIETGQCYLNFNLISSLATTARQKDIEIQTNKKSNKLHIDTGTKLSFNILDIDDIIKKPKYEDSKSLKIGPKEVSRLAKILKEIQFKMVYSQFELDGTLLVIENTKKGLIIKLADISHCIFYNYYKPLKCSKFKIITILEDIKGAFSFLADKTNLVVGENSILVNSNPLTVEIPFLQTVTQTIDNAQNVIYSDGDFKKSITCSIKDLKRLFESIAVVSLEGGDFITLTCKDSKLNCALKSEYGSAKDTIKIVNSANLHFKLQLPFIYLFNVINAVTSHKNIDLQLSKNGNTCRLVVLDKGVTIRAIVPTISA